MTDPTFRQRARYWFDNTMSKGTKALIGWLTVITLALTVIGAALVLAFAPESDAGESGILQLLWTSFLHVMDPGNISGDEGRFGYMIVMFAITIGGIVIVSSLVGILTTGLDAKLDELRKGRSLVVEKDHTVLLGWSDQVFIVVSELVEANESEKRACVVILADRDKVEMEDDIRTRIPDLKTTKVVCRTATRPTPPTSRSSTPARPRASCS